MTWNVYLSGEIHTDWRDELARRPEKAGLAGPASPPLSPITPASDDCGVAILGEEAKHLLA
jgi:hypothetical protein